MLEKIKKVFAIIGAVLTVIACTFFLVFLRRSDSDRRGSDGNAERDSAIKEGIGNAEESIRDSRDTADRCEEHLRRAEDILREAIRRSREG